MTLEYGPCPGRSARTKEQIHLGLHQVRRRTTSWSSEEGLIDKIDFFLGSVSHELAENVTALVGLREAIKAKHPAIKYIWVTLFILGIGATCYYLYRTTEEYLANPTATSVTL